MNRLCELLNTTPKGSVLEYQEKECVLKAYPIDHKGNMHLHFERPRLSSLLKDRLIIPEEYLELAKDTYRLKSSPKSQK